MEKGERRREERERRGRKVSVFSRRGGCSPGLEPAAASEGARSPSASRPQAPRRPPVPAAGRDRRADNGEGAPSRGTRGAEGGVCRCRCGTVPLRAGGAGRGRGKRGHAAQRERGRLRGHGPERVTASVLSAASPPCVLLEGQRGEAVGNGVEGSAGGCCACPALPRCCRDAWDGPVRSSQKVKNERWGPCEAAAAPPRLHSNSLERAGPSPRVGERVRVAPAARPKGFVTAYLTPRFQAGVGSAPVTARPRPLLQPARCSCGWGRLGVVLGCARPRRGDTRLMQLQQRSTEYSSFQGSQEAVDDYVGRQGKLVCEKKSL